MRALFLAILSLISFPIGIYSQTNVFPSSGNIGIGTDQPRVDLEISPSTNRPQIWLNSRGMGDLSNTDIFLGDNGLKKWSISHRPGDQNSDFVIWRNNFEWTRALIINYSNGYIGINTFTPEKQLDVNGDVRIGSLLSRRYLKISSQHWPEIRFETPLSNEEIRIGVAHADDSQYKVQEGDLYFYSRTTNSMPFIQRRNGNIILNATNGYVGIGTITPVYNLDVCGIIRAKEIKVDLQGACVPDFVFTSDYKLMDLHELEKFVRTNRHLPEIAPEKEMVENGVNMKEMQLKLLRKVEELTLYVIEQNKKIESLEKVNQLQNEEIVRLKKSK